MKVVFWHFIVNNDSRPDEPGIAVHLLNNGLQGCYIGFLSQGISYHDCHLKSYEEMYAVVVNMFSQDKFENPVWLIEEWFMLIMDVPRQSIFQGTMSQRTRGQDFLPLRLKPALPLLRRKSNKKQVVKVTMMTNLQPFDRLLDSKIIKDHLSCNHVRFLFQLGTN